MILRMMEPPSIKNYVRYECLERCAGAAFSRVHSLYGIKDASSAERRVYLWRNYNTYDEVSTLVPDCYVLQHNGDRDCTECNMDGPCVEHIEWCKKFMEDHMFGSKIFAENYRPTHIEHPGSEEYLIHDNGGRPFKVYVDKDKKTIHVYSPNRNVIFESTSVRKEQSVYYVTNEEVDVQLVMNSGRDEDSDDKHYVEGSDVVSGGDEDDEGNDEEVEDEEVEDEEVEDEGSYDPDNMPYDTLIITTEYEKIWIPRGYYYTRENGVVVRREVGEYHGNSILVRLDSDHAGSKYLYIGSNVVEFDTSDDILQYYSVVGNSDVPYPVAIGRKYAFFMLEGPCAEPIEKYKKLSKDQLMDAYSYYYGHKCCICSESNCDCKVPEYKKIAVESRVICEREF